MTPVILLPADKTAEDALVVGWRPATDGLAIVAL
jgi:hypothetical protein